MTSPTNTDSATTSASAPPITQAALASMAEPGPRLFPAHVPARPAGVGPSASKPSPTASNSTDTRDPLFDPSGFLVVEQKRDGVSSGFHANSQSVNSDLFLQEGMAISGTHYGLHIISTSGVVVISKGARILPSKDRASRIIAKKLIIAGEAILDRAQGDTVLALTDDATAVFGEVIYSQSLVTTEKSNWRVTNGIRRLSPKEKRAEHWYDDAVKALSQQDDQGFEAICRRQDEAIESDSANVVQETGKSHPPLAAVV